MPDGLARAAAAVQLSCRLAFFLCLCSLASRQADAGAATDKDGGGSSGG